MHDIRSHIPAPFEEPGTLLYVGYRADAHSWLDELLAAGNEVEVLEIWIGNLEALDRHQGVARYWLGDVRKVDALLGTWDYVWWWHGPEHVERAEFPGTMEKMRAKARKQVAVAAPWGRYEQGPHEGNPHERHQWSVYEADLEAVGLETATDGEADAEGSEVAGWTT